MMATTPNLNLPLIDENTVNDMPRDLNALAEAVDAAVTEAVEGVTVPDASLTEKGIVQLSNATNGTRENVAATEKAVGQAFQAGNERKAEVVAALVAIGISASTNETWAQLIPKIAAVIRATGNATAADILAGKTASNANGPVTGTIPVLTGNRTATGVAKWPDGALAVYPEKGYQKGGAGDGEIKVTSAQLQAAEAALRSGNLPKDVSIFGVLGVLERMTTAEKQAIANAITSKGVTASANDTNTVLAQKIGQISTSKNGTAQLNFRVQDPIPMGGDVRNNVITLPAGVKFISFNSSGWSIMQAGSDVYNYFLLRSANGSEMTIVESAGYIDLNKFIFDFQRGVFFLGTQVTNFSTPINLPAGVDYNGPLTLLFRSRRSGTTQTDNSRDISLQGLLTYA